jgi:hypothetical protein
MPVRSGVANEDRGYRPRLVAGAVALGALLVLTAPVAPAGAAAPTAPSPRPGLCARVDAQWARIVLQNKRAKALFVRASALRARLQRAGRTRLAHRLDVRIRYLRQIHVTLVDRVALIATRASGVCSGRPPALDSF